MRSTVTCDPAFPAFNIPFPGHRESNPLHLKGSKDSKTEVTLWNAKLLQYGKAI